MTQIGHGRDRRSIFSLGISPVMQIRLLYFEFDKLYACGIIFHT